MNITSNSTRNLDRDALAVWQAGIAAANAEHVTRAAIHTDRFHWQLGTLALVGAFDRVAIVGGGKAADGMARGACQALQGSDVELLGWVNVPDDLAGDIGNVRLHPGRPWGVNEPTTAAVAGTRAMLQLVAGLSERDLCLCLLSGGASALITAPPPGVTLEDKIWLVRQLIAAGADIEELNTVRRCLSDVKGGGLARACRAGQLVSLVISDVLGDDPAAIGSGPAVAGSREPAAALRLIHRHIPQQVERLSSIVRTIERLAGTLPDATAPVPHCILANLETAMRAASEEARRRGYRVRVEPLVRHQPDANDVGRTMARELLRWPQLPGRVCTISGGEPTLKLVDIGRRGRGGRNQQLVLAALAECLDHQSNTPTRVQAALRRSVLLSAGSDGEDGPTDAAGAILNAQVWAQTLAAQLDPRPYLETNDAYTFLAQTDGLIKTGWTGTNVGDLRVMLHV